jgi:outer membrane lipoprotein LolB
VTLTPDLRHSWRMACLLFATYLIAACAQFTPARSEFSTANTPEEAVFSRQGRLSLRVDSEPPQSLSGTFVISGNAQTGDLTLSTPLGSTLAQLSWTPQQAILKANNDTSYYPSTEALVEQVTGTALPLDALFDWLAGRNTPAPGWQTDLSLLNNPDSQRLIAKRTDPLPTVELRIVLDK